MTEFKSQQIKSAIKDLLKKKKMTYENVAEELECSVPTVKRILGDEELSLTRLLEFCDLLGVTLSDLEVLTQAPSSEKEQFTEEQQVFLAKNKNFLAYFLRLYEMTPAQIAEKYKLNARSTDKYLLGLEKHDLIKVSAKQKVKPAFKEVPPMERGPLGKAFYEALIQNSATFFIQNIGDSIYSAKKSAPPILKGFTMMGFKVSEATYRAFMEEQKKSLDALGKLAAFEEKSKPETELKTAVVIQACTLTENDDKHLEVLANTMGEVVNI